MDASDRRFMSEVIERSRTAAEGGDRPFAALIVADGTIRASAINTAASTGNPLDHAETVAVDDAVEALSREALAGATLYASAEPCPMCATASYYAGIRRVVFGASSPRLRDLLGPGMALRCRDVLEAAPEPVEVVGPVLEDDALAVIEHSGYRGRAD
jgi:tRNA(Arg) A34 adenosine deaminase TadA